MLLDFLKASRPLRLVLFGCVNYLHCNPEIAHGCRILRLIALALDLPASYFDDKFSNPVGNVRAVHYTGGEAADPARGVFGVGPHTDWGALTVLATDAEPGLQICLGGRWIAVEPRPGHFVVNLGDMIDR